MLKKDIPINALLYVGLDPQWKDYLIKIMFVSHHAHTGGAIIHDPNALPYLKALGIKVTKMRYGNDWQVVGCQSVHYQANCRDNKRYGPWEIHPEVQAFYNSLNNRSFTYLLKDDISIDGTVARLKEGITGQPEGEALLIKRF